MSIFSSAYSLRVSALINSAVYDMPLILGQAGPGDGIRKSDGGVELVPASKIADMPEVFDGYREGQVLVDGRVFEAVSTAS